MSTPDVVEPRGSGFVRANTEAAHLTGRSLAAVWTDNRLYLEFAEGYLVAIETPFAVTAGGTRWIGEPAAPEARTTLPVVGAMVAATHVADDGTLHLTIGDAAIEVPPNDSYEAWQLFGPHDLLVVCAPGGEYIAVFEPDVGA